MYNQSNIGFYILLEQEMMGWQWHQLDHIEIICTLLQTTTPVAHHSVFLQAGCPIYWPANTIKAVKAVILLNCAG